VTGNDNVLKPDEAVVEQQVFRDVIGRFASGVTVITTSAGGVAFGTTASAVSSLSADPPMLLVCLNKTSETGRAVAEAGVFGVNILAEGQEELAYKFATKGVGKFDGVAVETGQTGVRNVYASGKLYQGPYLNAAPDLIVGYAAGYRTSWEAAVGKVTTQVFSDNKKAWSGDHCVDPLLVPGVLFSNRKVQAEDPGIEDMAATALDLFGIQPPAWMEGKSVFRFAQ